ncbi:MAG: sugar ABC transporter ATP-binding protein [Ardenticatenaceae bacterium]|nr:sugar ABC transporter ATP-binding protein [Ardenticatenaceae bacterium]
MLYDVDLDARPGRVTAVMGENGAGKSTLMKILAGVYSADAGHISIDGNPVLIDSPRRAQEVGIRTIYQERNLVSSLSIAENLFLDKLPARGRTPGLIDWRRLRQDTEAMLARLGMDLSPTEKVKNLSPAQQQMVEIAKALTTNARILIMDEPTSALTDRETDKLFELIARLTSERVAVIFISHRLAEVFAIADDVIVLRDGACVGNLKADELEQQKLVDLMVGRTLSDLFPRTLRPEDAGDEVIFEVRGLSNADVHDISFRLRKGEILGLGGLMGAGRTETARALFGVDPADKGQIFVNGQQVRIRKPADAIAHGIGFVTEDRKREGLLHVSSVASNLTLAILDRLVGFLDWVYRDKEESIAREFITALAIVTKDTKQKVSSLSGGNQQKVVLSRWLATNPRILILDEPTKGIDVGAKAEIHRIMDELAQRGLSIILISSELPELLAMSDRVLVLRQGRIMAEYDRSEVTQEKVLISAMGHGERLAS